MFTTISLPAVPTQAQDVPEFGREVGRWMADGSARRAMARCFQLDALSHGLGLLESEAPRVARAENFWVTGNMVALLKAAAPSYPLDAHPPKPLVPHGLLVLQDPVKLWPNAVDLLVGTYWREGVYLPMLSYPPHVNRLVTFTPSIDVDSPPDDRRQWATATQEAWRVLATLATLLTQRIAVPRSIALDRAARRRLARYGNGPMEPVQLIDLRRPQARDDSQGGCAGPVDWQSRWVVGAHWRNQFMPGSGRHEPRWIAPFVKGPPDRPLVVRERVYQWRR